MDERDKEKKSVHLQELEEAFEKRTRRFSPFAILGLTPQGSEKPAETAEEQPPALEPSEAGSVSAEPPTGLGGHPSVSGRHSDDAQSPTHRSSRPPPGSDKAIPGTGVVDTPTHGSAGHTGVPLVPPSKAEELPSKKSFFIKDIEYSPSIDLDRPASVSDGHTRGSARPIPGMGLIDTPSHGDGKPPTGVETPGRGSSGHTHGFEEHPAGVNAGVRPRKASHNLQEELSQLRTLQLADVVAAMQLGNQLGKKARQVLAYLNTVRSPTHESYTLPVGYGQISGAAGIDAHYLRRKVLPKLAMLGLIGVARKSLEGTIYHLPHQADYVRAVTGELSIENPHVACDEPSDPPESYDNMAGLPDWIDRERWGWLSPENVRRLVQKAGSEEQAREKLEMIIYNETHGPPERRVRSHRSVLTYYLSSPQAEVWPNDDGFETLEMRRAVWERERARREKTLAEETLQARQEAERAKFVASLSEAQLQWLKQEAKRRVDAKPASRFLQSRYPLYKAEEDELIQEWLDRAAYGEHIPATDA
jgi:hypothetical protein